MNRLGDRIKTTPQRFNMEPEVDHSISSYIHMFVTLSDIGTCDEFVWRPIGMEIENAVLQETHRDE